MTYPRGDFCRTSIVRVTGRHAAKSRNSVTDRWLLRDLDSV